MCAFGERMSAVEIGAHEFDDVLVVFSDVAFEFAESSEHVFAGSVISEEHSEEGLDLEARWLGARAGPLVESLAAFFGDGVNVAGSIVLLLLVDGGETELDELLGFRVQQTFGLGPGISEAPLRLVREFVPGPRLEVEEGEDCK